MLWLQGLLLLCIPLSAQVHTLTFSYNSPPLPVANAGNDTLVQCSIPFTLNGIASGGTAPYTFRWQPGNLLNDSTLLQPTGSITSQTTFTLYITDSKGCTVQDQVVVNCSHIGVEEPTLDQTRLIPNPANGHFVIAGLPQSGTEIIVRCLSLQGALLATFRLSQGHPESSIDLSTFPSGMYMIILETPDSKMVHKLILQK